MFIWEVISCIGEGELCRKGEMTDVTVSLPYIILHIVVSIVCLNRCSEKLTGFMYLIKRPLNCGEATRYFKATQRLQNSSYH